MNLHHATQASDWVRRWTHLAKPHGTVLDVACGPGRHMAWFADHGFQVTGIDRSSEALQAARAFGTVVPADIESADWPLLHAGKLQQFDVVVVTNYLWRPLLATIVGSVAPGGLLLYETFAVGNETVGKPSRADFLLQAGELLQACQGLRVMAFEDGFASAPERFIQRIAAVAPLPEAAANQPLRRYPLSLK